MSDFSYRATQARYEKERNKIKLDTADVIHSDHTPSAMERTAFLSEVLWHFEIGKLGPLVANHGLLKHTAFSALWLFVDLQANSNSPCDSKYLLYAQGFLWLLYTKVIKPSVPSKKEPDRGRLDGWDPCRVPTDRKMSK